MRERCAVVVHIRSWQEAYQRLEKDVLTILVDEADALVRWCNQARQPDYEMVV